MSTKIKLGARPVAFEAKPITFPMPDGTQGVITVAFKYRTRTEYGQFVDATVANLGALAPAEGVGRVQAAFGHGVAVDGGLLYGAVHSWDVGDDGALSLAVCQQLAEELPAASQALLGAYRDLTTLGRLGN